MLKQPLFPGRSEYEQLLTSEREHNSIWRRLRALLCASTQSSIQICGALDAVIKWVTNEVNGGVLHIRLIILG